MKPTILLISHTDFLKKRFEVILGKDYEVKSHLVTNKKQLLNTIKNVWRYPKPDKIITTSSADTSNIFLFLLFFRKNTEKIHFTYDIANFYPKKKGIISRIKQLITCWMEKKILLLSDKIIHKGLKEELIFLPFYKKIKDKPAFLFREFIDNKDLISRKEMLPKLSTKDGIIHLAYIGGINIDNKYDECHEIIPQITNQDIHIHIYSKISKKSRSILRKIEKKNKKLHYEGFLQPHTLVKKITQYDAVIAIYTYRQSPRIFQETAFGNKIYDSIRARVPFIIPANLKASKIFIKKNNIGITITYNKNGKLKTDIKKELSKWQKDSKRTAFINTSSILTKFIGD